ncbi:MAG: hypothetical protein CL927_11045 [Deltaproteobacteria bacterium]|nr:hypothetical protein [Deltaproteobacteria bacterium]
MADLAASVVVFLVALPLCLGIALASGAPLLSGMVAGIVGGLVVGLLSPSHVQVSGPAAGLTAIVLAAIASQGSFEAFLPAVVIAGGIQLAMGLARLGVVARFVPSSVIKGMLAAIGLILILKQLPHLVGWDADAMGDASFQQADNENTFSEIFVAFEHIQQGALVVGLVCLVLMFGWQFIPIKKLQAVPAPLAAVLVGTLISEVLAGSGSAMAIDASHKVALPEGGFSAFFGALARPDWSVVSNPDTWFVAITIALVASLETLLCLEAAIKLDPWRRDSPPDKELIAQGIGNMIAGFFGGLPLTGVIVRSSANADAGAKTRFSAFYHAFWLILAIVALSTVLNRIPLAALAAILLFIGYRLARPALFRDSWKAGWSQFLPFTITVVAILLTDLLTGIFIGLGVGLIAVLREGVRLPALRIKEDPDSDATRYELIEQVNFLHKAGVGKIFTELPNGSNIIIDGTRCVSLDPDVLETIQEFIASSSVRDITVKLEGLPQPPEGGVGGH